MSTQTADRGLQPSFAQLLHPLTSSFCSLTDGLAQIFQLFANTSFWPTVVPWLFFWLLETDMVHAARSMG